MTRNSSIDMYPQQAVERTIQMQKIHPSSVIEAGAKIHPSVEIGPFCIIEKDVEIDAGCRLLSHVVIRGDTKIGKNNTFYQFSTIGEDPPDKKYGGESTKLIIGDNNIIRECVTIHIGTIQDEAKTVIGNNNLLLAYVHIAHDCQIGNDNIFANNTSLAGHVKVMDNVNFGGFAKVSQYCKIGNHAFICADCVITKDIPAFLKIAPSPSRPVGLNSVGLSRAGISQSCQALLKQAYKIIYQQKRNVRDAIDKLHILNVAKNNYLSVMIQTIENSDRGIIR